MSGDKIIEGLHAVRDALGAPVMPILVGSSTHGGQTWLVIHNATGESIRIPVGSLQYAGDLAMAINDVTSKYISPELDDRS